MRRPAARATQSVPLPKARRPGKSKIDTAPAAIAKAPAELAVTIDREQRRMVDEYGELDRRMQLAAPDAARFDALKRGIKSWFDGIPPDADGFVEGRLYRLHLSARERERRVRNLQEVIALIGMDKFLELAEIPLGPLEDLLGKARVAALVLDKRTGSRRIRSVPKRPVGEK